MIQPILTQELRSPLQIMAIDAHHARRQRLAQPRLAVAQIQQHDDRDGFLLGTVTQSIALDAVLALDGHAARDEQRQLAALLRQQVQRLRQLVQVVVVERLTGHVRRGGFRRARHGDGRLDVVATVGLARQQLDAGIEEAGLSVVFHRYPAAQGKRGFVLQQANVIRLPAQAAAEISQLQRLRPAYLIVEFEDELVLSLQGRGQIRKRSEERRVGKEYKLRREYEDYEMKELAYGTDITLR